MTRRVDKFYYRIKSLENLHGMGMKSSPLRPVILHFSFQRLWPIKPGISAVAPDERLTRLRTDQNSKLCAWASLAGYCLVHWPSCILSVTNCLKSVMR